MSTLKTDVIKDTAETVSINVVDIPGGLAGATILRNDLANAIDLAKGTSLVKWKRNPLNATVDSVRGIADGTYVNIWEYANLATGYVAGGNISTWDWRPAIQAALNALPVGGTLYLPAPHVYRVVNGTGTGANLIAQRADAVANNTLYALTSSTDGITIKIDGEVRSTSALDDVFRLSGTRARIEGNGTIRGPGIFHDVNPSGVPVTDQWYPTLAHFSGADSGSEGILYYDAPTLGVRLTADRGYARFNRFVGGLSAHGSGTMLMGVYAGLPAGGTYGCQVVGNTFGRSAENGACYSGIFCTAKFSKLLHNDIKSVLEHGVYNYGEDCIIGFNTIDDSGIAAGIQVFAPRNIVVYNEIKNCANGGILLENPDAGRVTGNVIWEGIGLYGIAVRTFTGTSPSAFMEDLIISENRLRVPSSVQSTIDVVLGHSFRDLKIINNHVSGGPLSGGSGREAAIKVYVLSDAGNPGLGLEISGNTVRGCAQFAVVIDRVQDFSVNNNKIVDANATSSDIAIRIFSSSNGVVDRNSVRDTRGTKLTSRIVFATTADLNSNILASGNNGIALLSSANPLCQLPTGAIGYNNGENSLGTNGTFTMTATTGLVVDSGVSPQAASVRAPALIELTPVGKAAADQQAGSKRLYVSGVGAGFFNIATSDGTAAVAATYTWRAIQ